MAYAIDIINDAFSKTKSLLFPVRKGYWLRMGLVSLLKAQYGGTNTSNFSNSFDSFDSPSNGGKSLREIVSGFNSQALDFLSRYGALFALIIPFLIIIRLVIMYFTSVFTFIFIDGVAKKDLSIKKSFAANKEKGGSLFIFRIFVGILNLFAAFIVFSPVISAFFQNSLADFNYWLLIPMVLSLILVQLFFGIVFFIVYDFLTLIMYFKNKPLKAAWSYFKEIAHDKKAEIFLYWLMKIVLGIAGGIISAVTVLLLLIVFAIIGSIPLIAGVAIYAIIQALLPLLLVLGAIIFIIWLFAFIYLSAVFTMPVRIFFQNYAILMLKKLEKAGKA